MFEPTEEMKAAYRLIRDGLYPSSNSRHLADLAQHATAAALEAEFHSVHYQELNNEGDLWCFGCEAYAPEGVFTDERHQRQPADWLRLADEKLRK